MINLATLTYTPLIARLPEACKAGGALRLDYLQVTVAARDSGTTVALKDVMLEGFPLGEFSATGVMSDWSVTGFDFSKGFTVSGNLALTGSFSTNQENDKAQLSIGCLTNP